MRKHNRLALFAATSVAVAGLMFGGSGCAKDRNDDEDVTKLDTPDVNPQTPRRPGINDPVTVSGEVPTGQTVRTGTGQTEQPSAGNAGTFNRQGTQPGGATGTGTGGTGATGAGTGTNTNGAGTTNTGPRGDAGGRFEGAQTAGSRTGASDPGSNEINTGDADPGSNESNTGASDPGSSENRTAPNSGTRSNVTDPDNAAGGTSSGGPSGNGSP